MLQNRIMTTPTAPTPTAMRVPPVAKNRRAARPRNTKPITARSQVGRSTQKSNTGHPFFSKLLEHQRGVLSAEAVDAADRHVQRRAAHLGLEVQRLAVDDPLRV